MLVHFHCCTAPAVEFANKLAASGSKNPVMVLKGTSYPNSQLTKNALFDFVYFQEDMKGFQPSTLFSELRKFCTHP